MLDVSVASTQYQRVYRYTFDCFNDLGDLVPIMCSEVPKHRDRSKKFKCCSRTLERVLTVCLKLRPTAQP